MTERLSPQRAAAHETLFVRLETLLRQAEAVAARRPSAPVPAETRAAAEALLYDTEHLLSPRVRRALPPAAESFAGLATQLGQALARLDAFEAQHAVWNAALGCRAWRLENGSPLPVWRLRPELAAGVATPAEDRLEREMRRKIVARFHERYEEGYARALEDARKMGLEALLSASEETAIQNS